MIDTVNALDALENKAIPHRPARPMGRADFLRVVQDVKRSGGGPDAAAGLRFARYVEALEAFTDGDGDVAALKMTPTQSRAAEQIATAAGRAVGGIGPRELREYAQKVADRHRMRLADVLRLDVCELASLTA